MKNKLHPTVYALGFTSFFTDFSSEMIYPLLPVFLKTVLGAGAVALGVIEGFAEFVASVLKIFSGVWADRLPGRKPLVIAGYTLSSLLRPLIGLAGSWPVVWLLRVGDRVGKGIRTSPRDALVVDVTDANLRGKAFGIQRSMDHAGAVTGPLVAAGLLALGMNLRQVFLLAFLPSIMVILILIFFVRETKREISTVKRVEPLAGWKELGRNYHVVLMAVVIFTLGNSTDAFLLLKLGDAGIKAEWIALLWSAHHVVKVFATMAGGAISDITGRRPMVISGWIYYAVIYGLFAFVKSPGLIVVVFLLYGIFYGLTEPTEKAWVADLAPSHLRGAAYGWYNGAVGLSALPASLIFGAIWQFFGQAPAFLTGAGLAVAASLILLTTRNAKSPND